MGTFVMVFFILQITNPNTTFIENEMSGFLSIVIFVYLGIMLSPLASFFINFLMILAVDIVASIFDGDHSGWSWAWAFLTGEILGAIGATLFYDKLFEPVINKLRQVRRDSINFS
jgi:glycerol uptake facilitator-like aquaporin